MRQMVVPGDCDCTVALRKTAAEKFIDRRFLIFKPGVGAPGHKD